MKASVAPIQDKPSPSGSSQHASNQGAVFDDNRQDTTQLREVRELANNSPRTVAQRQAFAAAFGNADPNSNSEPNSTGMPDTLKAGLESYSGMDLSDVKVHYNSSRPAQLQALAYAQGNDIHLGPGQEKHLPHEGWHVVQQRQGRVKPTLQMKSGVYINDNDGLEREADAMGKRSATSQVSLSSKPNPKLTSSTDNIDTIQCKVGFEFQTYDSVTFARVPVTSVPVTSVPDTSASESKVTDAEVADTSVTDVGEGDLSETDVGESNVGETTVSVAGTSEAKEEEPPLVRKDVVGEGKGFKVEVDGGKTENEVEIVTDAVDETTDGRTELVKQMKLISALAAGIAHNKRVDELADVDWKIKGLVFQVPKTVHFHPQATVGVKFEKIADLIEHATSAPFLTGGTQQEVKVDSDKPKTQGSEVKVAEGQQSVRNLVNTIGWSGKADQLAFKAPAAKGLADARKALSGISPEPSPSLISFASILCGFAAVTNAKDIVPDDSQYAKYFMPFMLRLSLIPHYDTLTVLDRKILEERLGDVLKTPFLPTSCPEGIMKEGDRHPTIEDLFDDEQVSGDDYAGYGSYINELGKLGMKDRTDIGRSDSEEKREGAIIELRKLGNDVKPGQLTEFALAVFDLMKLINAPTSSSKAATKGETTKVQDLTTLTSESS